MRRDRTKSSSRSAPQTTAAPMPASPTGFRILRRWRPKGPRATEPVVLRDAQGWEFAVKLDTIQRDGRITEPEVDYFSSKEALPGCFHGVQLYSLTKKGRGSAWM